MDHKVEITHNDWNEHTHHVAMLLDDVLDLKKVQEDHEKRLRTMEENMIRLPQVIQESITEAVQPLSSDNRDLNNQVAELKNEKYKFGYEILKWVMVTLGGGVLVYLAGVLANNLWG